MTLANVIGAFGLAGAAGLNAYIPLLIVAALAKVGLLELREPFDMLASWPAIAALAVLGIIEFTADKIPAVDHVNDVIQTFVRPAAGAVLFAANTGAVTWLDPTLALICGLLTAFGTHSVKAAARPAINAATMGIGTPVISLAEDIASALTTLLAIFAPLLMVAFVALLALAGYRLVRRARRVRQARAPQTAR